MDLRKRGYFTASPGNALLVSRCTVDGKDNPKNSAYHPGVAKGLQYKPTSGDYNSRAGSKPQHKQLSRFKGTWRKSQRQVKVRTEDQFYFNSDRWHRGQKITADPKVQAKETGRDQTTEKKVGAPSILVGENLRPGRRGHGGKSPQRMPGKPRFKVGVYDIPKCLQGWEWCQKGEKRFRGPGRNWLLCTVRGGRGRGTWGVWDAGR